MSADPDLLELLAQGRQAWAAAFAKNHDVPADLSSADLRSFRLVRFDLTGAVLEDSDISGVLMINAVLDRANLDRANLSGANLGGASLRGASLRQANLRGAELSDARLDGADLSGADLRGARLDACRLVGANLGDVLVDENIERAILLDSRAVWPQIDSDHLHRLELRVELDRHRPHWPTVKVLIDGQNSLGLEGHEGFDPDKIFSNSNPLLPTVPPRRIAIYRCRCGEAGCSVIAPKIVESGNEIYWRDFRDFTGVYVNPDTNADPSGGTKHGIPDLKFDAEQYRAEVERAASDRSWETHGRTVARLVQAELRSHSANFESREYRITSVGPYDDGAVSVWMQVLRAGVPVGNSVVRVAQPDGDPATLAARLAGQLVSSDVADWEIISHQDYPADLTRPSSPKP